MSHWLLPACLYGPDRTICSDSSVKQAVMGHHYHFLIANLDRCVLAPTERLWTVDHSLAVTSWVPVLGDDLTPHNALISRPPAGRVVVAGMPMFATTFVSVFAFPLDLCGAVLTGSTDRVGQLDELKDILLCYVLVNGKVDGEWISWKYLRNAYKSICRRTTQSPRIRSPSPR